MKRKTSRRKPAGVPSPSTLPAFAVATPGLEPFVAAELKALGIKGEVVDGGIEFDATRRQLYEANLHLRTASRVLVRLAHFRAISFAELEARARSIPWESVLKRGSAVSLRVTCRKSRLYHSGAVAERIARDLAARVDATIETTRTEDEDRQTDAQLIVVRFDHDRCTVSADSSGAHLHQRGYRTSVTQAPVRETLAAALIMASEWDRRSPLYDPFCGSGTVPIEAAMLAARMAPGRLRSFRFTEWPGFDQNLWDEVRAAAVRNEKRDGLPPISGSDRSASAIRAARDNAERAGVSDLVELEKLDVEEAGYDQPNGWIVANPPYGVRLGDARDAARQLSRFGDVLRQRFAGWHVGLLAPNQLDRQLGFRLESRSKTTNGGLRVQILTGTVPVIPAKAGIQ